MPEEPKLVDCPGCDTLGHVGQDSEGKPIWCPICFGAGEVDEEDLIDTVLEVQSNEPQTGE